MPLKSPSANQTGPMMTGPSIQLPAGDWCIFFDLAVPLSVASSGSSGYGILGLGAQSDTVISDNNSLTLTVHDSPAISGGVFGKLFTLQGIDREGNQLGNLLGANNMGLGGTQKILTPAARDQIDGGMRTWFLEKQGNRFRTWLAGPGVDPVVTSRSRRNLTWKGFSAAVPLTLFSLLRTDQSLGASKAGRGYEMARVGYLSRAMTHLEKVAFANGANPATLIGMAAPDLYWPLANTAAIANASTIADGVQGANLTAVATTWQVPANVTPTALAAAVRIYCPESDYVYSSWEKVGGFIDVKGAFTTTNPAQVHDVQIRAVDSVATATVVSDWQTVATNVTGYDGVGNYARDSGAWAGKFVGLPWAKAWMRWEIRLVIATVAQASQILGKPFGVGLGAVLAGQSIIKQGLGITGIGTGQGANSAYHTVHMPSPCSTTDGDQNYQTVQSALYGKGVSGYGINAMANAIATVGNCCVITSCPAKSGASIGSYARFDDQIENLDWAINSMQHTNASVLIWNQGNSTTPTSGDSYYDDLELLYNKVVLALGRRFKFGVMPVGNDLNTSQSPQTLTFTRRDQMQWINDSIAKGRDVFFVGSIMDLDLIDTTHPQPGLAGAGRMATRIAQSIVAQFDKAVRSGVGPTIRACLWDGGNTIKVKVRHNGGTALKSVAYVTNIGAQSGTYPDGVGPINNGQPLTGWTVATTLARTSAQLTSTIAVTNAAITGADEITLTLASVPTRVPYVAYLEGKPGFSATATSASIDNLVYDDRTPSISPTLGYPLEFTASPVRCVPQLVPVVAGVMLPSYGPPIPIVAGWGLHPRGRLVTPVR